MPPLSRVEIAKLIVTAILGVVALVVGSISVVHVGRLFGVGVYPVTVSMPDSGGIFEHAEVTYQGVPAGRVGKLQLTKSGVDVTLQLDAGKPRIPASVTAVVANRSAIGEQYIDLRPTSAAGPFLHAGSRITQSEQPAPLEDVVNSALDFAESVPVEDLQTIVEELGKAFNGQGENLTRL
ncbi:MlaD family protein, partial [Gordonia sp. (in: high G+C Gram-positive bacteria)]|uniref:MlaD family protein n=1 Tax=Gordonia sp. (in: high G+C Gram-positive bacteria) TaxID=84139 RepID=UPI0039E575B2